jgi:hypothetical protein
MYHAQALQHQVCQTLHLEEEEEEQKEVEVIAIVVAVAWICSGLMRSLACFKKQNKIKGKLGGNT